MTLNDVSNFLSSNSFFIIIPLALSIFVILFTLLNRATNRQSNPETLSTSEKSELQDLKRKVEGFHNAQLEIEQRINDFKELISKVELTDEERRKYIDLLEQQLTTDLRGKLLEDIEDKFYLGRLREEGRFYGFDTSLARLTREIAVLRISGNFNLVIGATTAGAGLWFAYTLLTSIYTPSGSTPQTALDTLQFYLPRLSVFVFIQIFAFFFLRLYRAGLDEIKYFQNELTNIDMKRLAYKTATLLKDESAMTTIITKLADTERNFILEPGQTTVEIEKERLAGTMLQEIADALNGLISQSKKTS